MTTYWIQSAQPEKIHMRENESWSASQNNKLEVLKIRG